MTVTSWPAFVQALTSSPAITDDGSGSGGKTADTKTMRTDDGYVRLRWSRT